VGHYLYIYIYIFQNNFFILTNAGAENFKLVTAPDDSLTEWKDLITMKPTEKIEDVDLFQKHIVVYGRQDGLPMILCHDLANNTLHNVDLPEKFCVLHPGTNLVRTFTKKIKKKSELAYSYMIHKNFNTDTFRFSIVSPFTHESTYEYNMSSRQLNPVRIQTIKSKKCLLDYYFHFKLSTPLFFVEFDRSKFTCSQIHVKSHDDKDIPVTLIHKKGIEPNGRLVFKRSIGKKGNQN
jgi:oligopeptidase B